MSIGKREEEIISGVMGTSMRKRRNEDKNKHEMKEDEDQKGGGDFIMLKLTTGLVHFFS